MDLDIIPMIRQELAGGVDPERHNLVKSHEFVPSCLCTWELVKLRWALKEAFLCGQVGQLFDGR